VALLEFGHRVLDTPPPELGGVVERDFAVLDEGVHRVFGAALEAEAVEAGPLQAGARPATVVAVGDRPRERGFRTDGDSSGHHGLCPGQGTVHERQQVVLTQRVHVGPLVEDVFHTEAAAPDVLLRVVVVDPVVIDRPRTEVDTAHVVLESA